MSQVVVEVLKPVKYHAYPEYKDSGVAWLGNTPSHWAVFHGKRLLSQRRETAKPESTQLAASQAYGVIPQSLLMEMTGNKVMLALKGTDNFKHVSENDFVISLRSFEGGIEHSSYSGCVSPAYTVLQAVKAIHPWFYRYLFKSAPYIAALQASTDSLRDGKSITFEQFGSISLPLPSPEEQCTIAAFLDCETARIDRLIAQQQRLIALLKEKRQAVISHAVTKGLNPNAPMKDSGVEWLGQVPEHWVVTKSSYLFSQSPKNGISPPVTESDDGIPTFSISAIRNGKVNIIDNLKMVDLDVAVASKFSVHVGDAMVVRGNGNLSMVGAVGIVSETVPAMCVYPDILIRVKLNEGLITTKFFVSAWSSKPSRNQIENMANTTNGTYKINGEHMRSVYLAIPPLTEQSQISEYLDNTLGQIDDLVAKSKSVVELLIERRTALISAAVTGKIDLRGWTPPVEEASA